MSTETRHYLAQELKHYLILEHKEVWIYPRSFLKDMNGLARIGAEIIFYQAHGGTPAENTDIGRIDFQTGTGELAFLVSLYINTVFYSSIPSAHSVLKYSISNSILLCSKIEKNS